MRVERSGKPSLSRSRGGVSPARRRPSHPVVAQQGRPTFASERYARCGVKGKRRIPRAATPDSPRAAPRQATSSAFHYPNAGSACGKCRARPAALPIIFVQAVSRGEEESIYRCAEASATRQGSSGRCRWCSSMTLRMTGYAHASRTPAWITD